MLAAIDLRHYLAEEQQKESQDDSDADKLQPIGTTETHRVGDEVVAEHDDGDVHQVVGYQDGCQRTLGVIPERHDLTIVIIVLVQLAKVGR